MLPGRLSLQPIAVLCLQLSSQPGMYVGCADKVCVKHDSRHVPGRLGCKALCMWAPGHCPGVPVGIHEVHSADPSTHADT